MKQYHEDGELWQYLISGEKCNTCGCNVFHHEYIKSRNQVIVVCNACDNLIATFKEEYTQKELSKGVWK